MPFFPADPGRSHPERNDKVHPLVKVSYWPRMGGHPLMALAALSAMDDPSSVALPLIAIALVGCQVLNHEIIPFEAVYNRIGV